jgi:hypothetical protein
MFRPIWPSSGVNTFSGGNCCYCMCPSLRTYVVLGVVLPVVFSCLFCFLMLLNVTEHKIRIIMILTIMLFSTALKK